MIIGYDNKNQKLDCGDICKFTIDNKEYEGMIIYDEESFAYALEMKDDKFPIVLICKTDFNSIEKIISIWSTQNDKDRYEFYRELVNKNFNSRCSIK